MGKKGVTPRDVDAQLILRAVARAYALGYLSTTGPKLLGLITRVIARRTRLKDGFNDILGLCSRQTALNRFPAFCAIVVGGSLSLLKVIEAALAILLPSATAGTRRLHPSTQRLARLASSFIASLIGIAILNWRSNIQPSTRPVNLEELPRRPSQPPTRPRRQSLVQLGTQADVISQYAVPHPPPTTNTFNPLLAGKTMTLTAFALVRAAEVVVGSLWASQKRRHPILQTSRLASLTERFIDPTVFAASSCIVMWSWFYTPERLPRAYNRWISSAAQIDQRLIQALREARWGNFVYGQDTGIAPLLGGMARDLGLPYAWGDPNATIPVPCELVHGGTGPNCEYHALSRFLRAFSFSIRMYLPLNLILLWRKPPAKRSVTKSLVEASRSSAFLSAFVTLFYYGVCLARTRIGPVLFSRDRVTPMMWDAGLCVGAGCAACGWSIFLEKESRRQEMAFFVAPRAVASILPQSYERKHFWREQLAFATSAAVLLTAAQENPQHVRGVFGRLLQQVIR